MEINERLKIINKLNDLLYDANWTISDVVDETRGVLNPRAVYRAFSDGIMPIKVLMELAYVFGVDTDEILQQGEYIEIREGYEYGKEKETK